MAASWRKEKEEGGGKQRKAEDEFLPAASLTFLTIFAYRRIKFRHVYRNNGQKNEPRDEIIEEKSSFNSLTGRTIVITITLSGNPSKWESTKPV